MIFVPNSKFANLEKPDEAHGRSESSAGFDHYCALFDQVRVIVTMVLDGCRPVRTIVHRPKGVYYEVLELRLFRSHQRKVLHKSTTIWGILMPAARNLHEIL